MKKYTYYLWARQAQERTGKGLAIITGGVQKSGVELIPLWCTSLYLIPEIQIGGIERDGHGTHRRMHAPNLCLGLLYQHHGGSMRKTFQ